MTLTKTYLLVAVLGTQTQIVKQGVIQLVQSEKTKLQKEVQWKRYTFQVRTPGGYKAIKIWNPKKHKKTEI